MNKEDATILENLVQNLNHNYSTIVEVAKEMGYKRADYLGKKVKKLNLGYKLKGIYLLSSEDKEILKSSIQRRVRDLQPKIANLDLENNLNLEDREKKAENCFIKNLNENYTTVNELSLKYGYSDGSAFFSRKVKKLNLGIKIKTVNLLSPKDQESLLKETQRRRDSLQRNTFLV